jgi:hypothetical protein
MADPLIPKNEPDIGAVIDFERDYWNREENLSNPNRPAKFGGPQPAVTDKTAGGITSVAGVGSGVGVSASGSTGSSGGQREITCPNCEGSVILSIAARTYSSIAGFLQRYVGIRLKIPTAFIQYLKERTPVDKDTVFKGNCPVCNGTKKIKDPSDDSQRYAQAAAVAQQEASNIQENEAKLGMGGNRVIYVQNNEYKKVGLVHNDAPSYRVDPDASVRMWGMSTSDADPETTFGCTRGGTCAHVQGLNPIATPGGQYTIECTNRFTVITGALGIELKTGGPITLNGGITRIVGPEITVGSSRGKLALEGEVVNITGKSIEMAPSDGQVVVKGSGGFTGNLTVGGNNHSEKISFIKGETVGKNKMSKVGAPSNIYCGPAFWGSLALEGIAASIKEYAQFVLANTSNPEQSKLILSPRFALNIADNVLNIAYMARPQELVQTGWAVIGPGIIPGIDIANPLRIPIYNFPHIHAMPDGIHTHETRVPDIKCDADTAAEVRSAKAGNEGAAPLAVFSNSVIDAAKSFWELIESVIVAPLAALIHGNYIK